MKQICAIVRAITFTKQTAGRWEGDPSESSPNRPMMADTASLGWGFNPTIPF